MMMMLRTVKWTMLQRRLLSMDAVKVKPVFKDELLKRLDPAPGKRYLDLTFGDGGHTAMLLEACPDIQVRGKASLK